MRYLTVLTAILLLGLTFTGLSGAEEPKQGDMDPARTEAMKKWMEYAAPGDAHKVLDYFTGRWDYTVKYWMDPDTPPQESTGTNDVKWIMGGRFLQMDAKGSSTDQPFEGMGIMGYNNLTKEYSNVWIDNMGTGMMTASGSYDAGTKTFTETGTFTCVEGQKEFRAVTAIVDGDNYSYELYAPGPDGKEFLMLDIKYKRKS